MRRAICITEPAIATAGRPNTWRFVYIPSVNLPKGTCIKFDPLSRGRDSDWKLPETTLKKNTNAIWCELPSEKVISGKKVESDDLMTQYEFVIPEEIPAGERLVICMGTTDMEARADKGNQAQWFIQRRRAFNLFVDPKGKGDYGEPEIFNIDVKGDKLENIRIITPSLVYKNYRFDVIVRFEDKFGNLTSNAPEDTLIELTYDQLRENLNWKLFIPETGFIALPNIYFNEAGNYVLKLNNLKTGESFKSAPIKCFLESDRYVNWGVLHGESKRFDGTENMESALRHVRDDLAYQFYSSSPPDYDPNVTPELWKSISTTVAEFNEDDRFVTFLGSNWNGSSSQEGMRQFLVTKDHKPLLRKKDSKTSTLKKIYKLYNPKELISIPCFTMAEKCSFNFENFNPDFERVVEIYNAWGSSECTEKEGNTRPISGSGKKTTGETAEGSLRAALNKNMRFGFVAGGLDQRGIYADFYGTNQTLYSSGLTAIFAKDYSRESLFNSLYNRHCYATTGDRILISFNIAKAPMGSELSLTAKPGLQYIRHISGFVAGTDKLKKVEIFRNGEVYKCVEDSDTYFEFEIDDTEDFKTITIESPDERPPFVYYYLRVTQENGQIGWSSPIWIDLEGKAAATEEAPKRGRKK
ncbi:MAG: hypothetical protein S4CHLAM102_10490 [Chlamydiia bacterium]|nr:hypothetical protein [Chlamydiia bacterium]